MCYTQYHTKVSDRREKWIGRERWIWVSWRRRYSEAERIRQMQNVMVDGLSIDGPHGVRPQS